MRLHLAHTRELLTYSVSGTPLSGGADESTGLAASLGDNGAPAGGVAGPAFVPWGAPRVIKGGAFGYSLIHSGY